MHTRAVSSTDFSNLHPAIRDAVDGSIAKIVQVQNDEGPPATECFEHCERQAGKACMNRGRRVLEIASTPIFHICRYFLERGHGQHLRHIGQVLG